MPFDFFQNAMYLAMLEEAESGNAGTQPIKEYSSNRPKKSECFASAFLFSDFFGMFPCLKKSRGSGQSPVFLTAINFVIFEKLLSRDFTSLTFVSLIISILGGTLIEKLHMEKYVEDFIYKSNADVLRESSEMSRKERTKYAYEQMSETFKKVFPYILIGVAIGAFIHNWIPEKWVGTMLGNKNPFGVILAVAVGTPMYADIFGTIPVAEALLGKGALLGTILAFMMAVTTLSLPSLIMLRKAIKLPLLALFVTICVAGIILVGYLFNIFQQLF